MRPALVPLCLLFAVQSPAQVLDVNGDAVVGPEEVLAVEEQWKGPASAANDHDHLGQTWIGDATGLILKGAFQGFPFAGRLAPLTLQNSALSGYGLYVDQSSSGIFVNSPDYDGIRVHAAARNGITIQQTGRPGSEFSFNIPCGVFISEVSGYGIYARSVSKAHYAAHFSNLSGGGGGLYVRGGGVGAADIDLGGSFFSDSDSGVVSSTEFESSDMQLRSNDDVGIYLDDNQFLFGEDGRFFIYNGLDNAVFTVDESGVVKATGTAYAGSSAIQIDHPLDPENKYLLQAEVISSEMKTIQDGLVELDEDGSGWVELPEYFEALYSDFRYQLTCVGGYAPVYVAEETHDNHFRIAGGKPGLRVSWMVTGIRKDPFAKANPIKVEKNKSANEKGKYLHPELIEPGMAESVLKSTPQQR